MAVVVPAAVIDLRRAVLAGALATVAAQICYPLATGDARNRLTIAIVVLFAAVSMGHARLTCGGRCALAVLLVTAVGGFAAELLGVHTGAPFGRYGYADSLGARWWGVPPVIALAWTMFSWPAALVARRLVTGFAARVAVGAWALASWDLFLDPQMVAAGHWRWRTPHPHLPGVPTVPLTDYAGWLFVAALMSLAVQGLLRGVEVADDRLPIALYVWTWLSSTLALGAFLHLGAAAGWGALGMGLVTVPLVVGLVRARTATAL